MSLVGVFLATVALAVPVAEPGDVPAAEAAPPVVDAVPEPPHDEDDAPRSLREGPRPDAVTEPEAPVAPPAPAAVVRRPPPRPTRCGSIDHPSCSLFWLPLASGLLPGLGQVIDDREALPYIAGGVAGLGGAVASIYWLGHQINTHPTVEPDLSVASPQIQALTASLTLYQTAGFLSAYHVYQGRLHEMQVPTHHREVEALLFAPFNVTSLAKPKVVAPLVVLTGIATYAYLSGNRTAVQFFGGAGDPQQRRLFADYRGHDAGFTAAASYGAGVGEEAFFRGFFMSYLDHRWGWNTWLANATQAVVFGLAHGAIDVRMLFGFYLGWVAQSEVYDLTDSVFIHTWWDVLAFTAQFALVRSEPKAAATVWLPAITW